MSIYLFFNINNNTNTNTYLDYITNNITNTNITLTPLQNTQDHWNETYRELTKAGQIGIAISSATLSIITGGIGSGVTGSMLTATATTAGTIATNTAIQSSFNAEGNILQQIKTVSKDVWDATTNEDALKSMLISAVVGGGSTYAMNLVNTKPSLATGSYKENSVGINTIAGKDGILYEELSSGVPNLEKPVNMSLYNRFGGFTSPYTNNPIFKFLNSKVNGFSTFADFHDKSMTALEIKSAFLKATSIPPWLIISYCASIPSLCSSTIINPKDINK